MSARQQILLSLSVGLALCGPAWVRAAENPSTQTKVAAPDSTDPNAVGKPAHHATTHAARPARPAKAAKPAKQQSSKRSHSKAKPAAAQPKPELPKAAPAPAASTQTGTQ